MKIGRVKIFLKGFWDFGFKKGVYPREDYVLYEWYQVGFIKIHIYRKKNERIS